MTETLRPDNPDQLRDLLAWATAEEKTVEVVGGGSKRALGRPITADHVVQLGGMAGITLYEPNELVMTANPATPIGEIEAALGEKNQQLEFEPPNYGPLLASTGGGQGAAGGRSNVPTGTLGGAIACNLSGPRRIKSGAARDHFLGFHAVSGRGEIFKSGGRVVKNVTGYDLSKLMAGSWGTLAAMTEVTVKVLPSPEKTRTALLVGADPARAVQAMIKAMQSPHEVSGAAWLPASLADASGVDLIAGHKGPVAALRVEGPGPSAEYRCNALREMLSEFGATEELHSMNSVAFWREVRDVMPFAAPGDQRAVWKLSVPPAAAPDLVDELTAIDGSDAFLDWGGGLVWLALPTGADASHEAVRAAIERSTGHATLFRAPEEIRRAVPVFQPQPGARTMLAQRVKAAFDPKGILNPGRMYADI
ncbi:MAG: glycolate oxidase subunit GlcE [Alphaproteobacteria bacterium]|nr:glycolate oxidase subunit GlcE [Alphaproteobacteria bacterium]